MSYSIVVIVKVCKPTGVKRQHPTYTYRSYISLLNAVAIQCDSLKSECTPACGIVMMELL